MLTQYTCRDAFMKEHGKGPYTQAQYDQSLRDYPTVICK